MNRLLMTTAIAVMFTGLCFHSALAAGGGGWGYEGESGPSNWGKNYPICNGQSQSPINIYEGDAVANGITEGFVFKNYDVSNGLTMTMKNSGHGATISLMGSKLPSISGGGLTGEFEAAQFHFHWSGDETRGSEHQISSKGFPSELHIVHYNKKYPDIGTALTEADGLAVLGFMLEISAVDNPSYDNLVNNVANILSPDSAPVTLASQTLNSFLPKTFGNFYRYSGSLTTPACYETVTWTVFKESIKISRSQIATFLDLTDDLQRFVLHNARPVQPINGRTIEANFDPDIHWGYYPGHYDPPHWPNYYEACGQDSQSPVNIPSQAATKDSTLQSFAFQNFDSTAGINMELSNNGHTVTVAVGGTPPKVSGGSLPDTYNVAQFHFHWGKNSMRGSEHTVDAISYPMEVHVVMFKNSLGTLGASVKAPEGLAVLGFFFEISDTDNPALNPILNSLTSVQNPGDKTQISTITLDSFLPADRSKFYRYSGSLTTPGCYQSVVWTVFDSKISVSEAQMAKFRALLSSEIDPVTQANLPMVDNFRPPQFLNSRIIRRNFDVVAPPKQKWTYYGGKGAQNWDKYFAICKSEVRQSPIDILPRDVEFMNIPQFEFKNFGTTNGVALKVNNNGHSVTVSYKSGDLQVSQGGLKDTYQVAQFHFHWGSVDTQGSEHLIAGKSFPMELHVVTYNKQYSSIGLAMTQGNGLAVLGFMMKISEEDNPALNTLVSRLSQISLPDEEVDLPAFSLDSILPSDRSSFFRYDGSLTTPTCDESVTWSVFNTTIPISAKQLNEFRRLESSEMDDKNNTRPMVDNFRPVQPLNGRVVYANYFISAAPSRSTTLPVVASFVFTLGKLAWGSN